MQIHVSINKNKFKINKTQKVYYIILHPLTIILSHQSSFFIFKSSHTYLHIYSELEKFPSAPHSFQITFKKNNSGPTLKKSREM